MTPLDIFNAAKQEYWSLHGGPQRDQPGGNSYECDEFIARKVFEAGQRRVASTPVQAPKTNGPCTFGELAIVRDERDMLRARIAELKPAQSEDRRCGTCEYIDVSDRMFPCVECRRCSHWQKR